MHAMTAAHRDLRPADGLLVEREAALAALRRALDEAISGAGRVVIVRGEAGIGKSALVRAFIDDLHPGTRVAAGTCDGLATPRPFAPLEDMVQALGAELGALLDGDEASHGSVARWVRDRLARSGPGVLVVEDVQWGDEATLALLQFLAGRLAGLTTLMILTCRDDEGLTPVVERTLGRLATIPGVRQLSLPRLTRAGIAAIASGSGADIDELVRLTGGNPLFVGEVLRSADGGRVPVSIRAAIRARIATLGPRARRALDAAAIAGPHAEPWLVAVLAGEDVLGVDDGIREGLLRKDGTLAFAHELTRLVVLDEMPVIRGIALHRRALDTLRRAGSTDSARLAHHAEAAADAAAVVEHATAAGRRAVAMSALREAMMQFRRGLRFAGHLDGPRRADLLERLSYVLYLRNELAEAYELGREAVSLRRAAGDVPALGSSLSALAMVAWLTLRGTEAWSLAREAVALTEPLGDSHELGMAWATVGRLGVGAGFHDEVRASSRRALEIGERRGDAEVRAIGLANLGTMQLSAGDPAGYARLEESLRFGRECGVAEVIDRALNNLGACATIRRELRRADAYFTTLEEFGERSEIVRCSIDAPRAEITLGLGDWAAAERYAEAGGCARDPIDRALSNVVLARLAVRRGDGDVDRLLAEPRELLARLETTQVRWPLLSVLAERAWHGGNLAALEPELRDGYDEACRQGDEWAIGELGRWLWVLGVLGEIDERAALPYRLEVSGDVAGALGEWDRLELPYEAAMCVAQGGDLEGLRRAHRDLVRLGAAATADRVRARIRALGGGAPRGPRRTTMEHPDGLTDREAQVAALLARGHSNAQIGAQLGMTAKTVAHHTSSVLAKLGLDRRGQVAAAMGGSRGR